jgi:hypothetical protein
MKAYIADQPLRGLMPQPITLRKELIKILTRLKNLQSEPEAIPDTPGLQVVVKSEKERRNTPQTTKATRKHLHRLYPLLSGALKAAQKDQEVLRLLADIVQEVGTDFGI